MSTYRNDFPIFASHPDLVYLDTAATSQKPQVVIEAVSDFYRNHNANIHRGLYPLSLDSSQLYEEARTTVQQFLHAPSPKEIVFVRGATEGLNLLATSLTSGLHEGDEIILSYAEHHSNLIPWQEAAKRHNLVLKFTKLTDRGDIDLSHLEQLMSSKTKIVSLTHCSNVLGRLTDAPAVKKIIDRQGSQITFILDASQSAPHYPLDIQALGCDFLVFSGHKTYGPSGSGVLWGRESLLEALPPYQTGGDMIKTATTETAIWNDLPWKFEAGTPNLEGAIGLAAALRYLEHIDWSEISQHTATLSKLATQHLQAIPAVSLIGEPDPESGIISFTVEGNHPHDLADLLGQQTICIRAGHHCAAPLHTELGIAASNRISIGLYTTEHDIEQFTQTLTGIINDIHHA